MSGLLAVDPGIGGTGLALFDRGVLAPTVISNICPIESDAWGKRLHYVCTLYEEFLYQHKPGDIFIEQPVYMPGSRMGTQAAMQGNLVKLAMLTGAIYWISVGMGIECNTVLPQQWKGSKKKEDVHRTLFKLIPSLTQRKYTTHELDAVGLGLYAKGFISKGNKRNV